MGIEAIIAVVTYLLVATIQGTCYEWYTVKKLSGYFSPNMERISLSKFGGSHVYSKQFL